MALTFFLNFVTLFGRPFASIDMRIFLFTLSFLVLGISVTGQESQAISAADFSKMVYQGTRAIARPYRYTAKPSGDVGVKREVDAIGSVRTTVLNHRTGAVDIECVVIGNQIAG